MSNKIISINCDVKDYLEIGKFTPLQGSLKDKSKEDLAKLKKLILEKGWMFPLFVAKVGADNLTLDGHGRDLIAAEMKEEGYRFKKPAGETGLELPVVFVFCKDRKEAKEQLLFLNSRYGKITEEGLYEYLNEEKLELNFEEIKLKLDLPELNLDNWNKNINTKNVQLEKLFEIVIECDSENEQEKVYNEISGKYKCRLLTL